jgi:hypothetical protein
MTGDDWFSTIWFVVVKWEGGKDLETSFGLGLGSGCNTEEEVEGSRGYDVVASVDVVFFNETGVVLVVIANNDCIVVDCLLFSACGCC